MNRIRSIGRLARILAGLAAAALAFAAAPAAFAMEVPPPGAGGHAVAPQHLLPVHTAAVGGMPGWQITLIATAAALVTAALAVLADRALTARRRPAASAA